MERVFVTGAAGFIGSTLVDRLLADGQTVVGWDNFTTGQRDFLTGALHDPRFTLIHGDNLDVPALTAAMAGCDFVFHLAANADVRFGTNHPRRDLEQNTIATSNVLEAMRSNGVRRLAFSSTGSVYGEHHVVPTPEDAPMPLQTSLYAASKLAGEALIEAYCEGFGFQGFIFRFVSILGERYTHGHVFDFHKQLLEHPDWLRILGNGRQRKSYLHVQDCIDGIMTVIDRVQERVSVFNLGQDGYCAVNDSVGWICSQMGLKPRLDYSGGERGWIGDNPFIFLDTTRVRALGWRPRYSIEDGVRATVRFLDVNRWVYAQARRDEAIGKEQRMVRWPVVRPGGPAPVWNGRGFTLGDRQVPVLVYNQNDSGWSDGLTQLHEESAGREHYIDRASRTHALAALQPILGLERPVVLEVGCSSGYFLDDLSRHAPHAFAIGSDYLPGPLFRLHQEMPALPLVQFDLTAAPFADGQFDAIVALNVLEHIDDHEKALAEMTRLLRPGGVAVIEVPAGPGLYDFYDAHLQHFRRYRRADLKALAEGAGLEVVEASHLGFLLYPAFALVKKRNRLRMSTLSEEQRRELVGRQIKMARSNPLLNALMKLELAVGRLVNYPWGIRCLLTARKPGRTGAAGLKQAA